MTAMAGKAGCFFAEFSSGSLVKILALVVKLSVRIAPMALLGIRKPARAVRGCDGLVTLRADRVD